MNETTIRNVIFLCVLFLTTGCAQQQNASQLIPSGNGAGAATGYSGSLLYFLDGLESRTLSVFTFPAGHRQKRVLMPTEGWDSLCSDSQGHVFVPANGVIFKYAHGGHRPIAELQDDGSFPVACAADPTTGNLAVLLPSNGDPCSIAIYKQGKGSPSIVNDANGTDCVYPTYDSSGNLFVYASDNSTSTIAELPDGSTQFEDVSVNQSIPAFYGMQWDGTQLAILAKPPGSLDQPISIYRVAITGTTGTLTKIVHFQHWMNQIYLFYVQGDQILAPIAQSEIGLWKYPQGGKQIGSIRAPHDFEDFTVSVAP